jgi:Lecithin retinol acyltransferase
MSSKPISLLPARHEGHCVDAVLEGEPALGAHLVTKRSAYEHHGIYVGNGRVVHYSGFACAMHRGPIEETTLEQFAAAREVLVRQQPMLVYSGQDAVLRARSRLGENRYRLLTNNCEHLCAWVLFGEKRSRQVEACLAHPALACRFVAAVLRELIETKGQDSLFAA